MNAPLAQLEPLSEQTFHRFRQLIYEKTNIHMREGKHILVANRLRKRIISLGLGGYEEYYRYLTEGNDRRRELVHFIDAVSTNETFFFRETNHFRALTQRILPELFRVHRTIRIWSAGCATGEEPYTLKILVEQGRGSLWEGEARIIATDISSQAIGRARQGVYRGRSIRFVPPEALRRFFLPLADGSFQAGPELRQGVEFQVHNLLQDPAPERGLDLIFCRNVMIYFDKPTQRKLVDEIFAEALDPRGYLCIGHSESLTGTSQRLRYVRELKAPIYQRVKE